MNDEAARVELAQRQVHEALQPYLEDDEIAVSWVLTIEVAGVMRGTRGLAHRAGGGDDGTHPPTPWGALGMLVASSDVAREQLTRASSQPQPPPG